MSDLNWYAVDVASRKEALVASVVTEKGYECFLPLYNRRALWSDRIKVSAVPLFAGYVFCRFDPQFRLPILVTPGVRDIVGARRVPIPIADSEIEGIRLAVLSGFALEPCSHLKQGDRVLITKGPLKGVEGMVVRHHGTDRLLLSVTAIQQSLAVEVDKLCVELIPTPKDRTARNGECGGNTGSSVTHLSPGRP